MKSTITKLNWRDIESRVENCVAEYFQSHQRTSTVVKVFGIPRGGIIPACSFVNRLREKDQPADMTDDVLIANVIIDDIVDSGHTRDKILQYCPSNLVSFYSLVDKTSSQDSTLGWVVFPWENAKDTHRNGEQFGPTENIVRLLEYIGENPNREGLVNTPTRVIKSYEVLFGGYNQDPKDVLTVFEDENCDEMVLLRDIEFFSHCEHHMMPFFGKAHIAYIPDGKIIGVSKLARILEIFSRRLQIQERLCQQITECLMTYLKPKGAACIIEARHLCMTSRGVHKQNSIMETSSVMGVFRDDARARSELMTRLLQRQV